MSAWDGSPGAPDSHPGLAHRTTPRAPARAPTSIQNPNLHLTSSINHRSRRLHLHFSTHPLLTAYHITEHPCQILGSLRKYKRVKDTTEKMITKCSSGVWPAWIGSVPETPALNLFTNLFPSSFKLLLKASPLGSLPRSTKLLAASVGWPCLNRVLPGVFLTHLPPQRALSLVRHSQPLGQASVSSPALGEGTLPPSRPPSLPPHPGGPVCPNSRHVLDIYLTLILY